MIRFNQVSKKLKTGQVLFNSINFHLPIGGMILFKGMSGAGKTTLIKLILGIDSFEQGQIEVDRTYVKHLKEPSLSYFRRKFGVICQGVQLLSEHNVFYNVALPLLIARYSSKEVKQRVFAALDKVNLLEKSSRMPQELSEGEKKAVSIARALINKPKILLADELFSNLDKESADKIWNLFQFFNEGGITTVLTSNFDEERITQNMQQFLIADKKIERIN